MWAHLHQLWCHLKLTEQDMAYQRTHDEMVIQVVLRALVRTSNEAKENGQNGQ